MVDRQISHMNEIIYSATQIRGDLAFLKYAIKKNQVQLRTNTGLQKLIEDCEHYLSIQEVRQEEIKPITVLYTLINSLKKALGFLTLISQFSLER